MKKIYFCRVKFFKRNKMKNQKFTWYEIKERNLQKQKLEEDRKKIEEDRKKREEDRKRLDEKIKQREEEFNKFMQRTEKIISKSNENIESFSRFNSNFMQRTEKMISNSNERIEGISRSNGEFCEEYFINSFKENPTLFGERFDRVLEYHRPLTAVIDDEYDLILRNCTTVALIEMKYKAGINDVGKMFSKLNSYRANYPSDNNYKIYLCLASFRFPAAIRARAADEGIVLIQQRGEKIEVISKNIRYW